MWVLVREMIASGCMWPNWTENHGLASNITLPKYHHDLVKKHSEGEGKKADLRGWPKTNKYFILNWSKNIIGCCHHWTSLGNVIKNQKTNLVTRIVKDQKDASSIKKKLLNDNAWHCCINDQVVGTCELCFSVHAAQCYKILTFEKQKRNKRKAGMYAENTAFIISPQTKRKSLIPFIQEFYLLSRFCLWMYTLRGLFFHYRS